MAATSHRRAAHQRVGRIKNDAVARLETRDNLDRAAIVPTNLDRRQLHAPIPDERNSETFRPEEQCVGRDHDRANRLRQLEMNKDV